MSFGITFPSSRDLRLLGAPFCFIMMGLSNASLASGNLPWIAQTDAPVKKAVFEEGGNVWVLLANSSMIHKYAPTGEIIAGHNVASIRSNAFGERDRMTVHDIESAPEGRLYALVGTVNPQSLEIASYVFEFAPAAPVRVIKLSRAIAGYRLGRDADGNFYVLGLDRKAHLEISRDFKPGSYELVHRFSPEGEELGSFLSMPIDPSGPDGLKHRFASPMHHAGNFAVDATGEVWLLWYEFGQALAPGQWPPSRLYQVDPAGVARESFLEPPGSNFFQSSLVKTPGAESTVLIEWKGRRDGAGLESALTTVTGELVASGDWPGRALAVDATSIVSSAIGVVPGKTSLFLTSLE